MFQQRQTHVRPSSRLSARLCSRLCLALSALSFTAACSADPVDLGSDVAVDRSALSSYAAVWIGYVEGSTFDSGSDRIQLELDEAGNGTMTLGEGEPPPLPTDPENPFNEAVPGTLQVFEFLAIREGLPYGIAHAIVEDERLRVRTTSTALYLEAACALQEPVTPFEPVENASCLPPHVRSSGGPYGEGCFLDDTSGSIGAGSPSAISCARLLLCKGVCRCDETNCFYERSDDDTITIDAAFDVDDPTRLVGSMGLRTIRLRRQ